MINVGLEGAEERKQTRDEMLTKNGIPADVMGFSARAGARFLGIFAEKVSVPDPFYDPLQDEFSGFPV